MRKGASALTRAPVTKGVVSSMRGVPSSIAYPEYALTGVPTQISSHAKPRIYNEEEIVRARRAGRLARKMLDFACNLALQPGVSTDDVDRLTHEEICRHGAYPSPINYRGFPKAICTSVNEVVCHGIPDSRLLEDGDIVSIDVSLFIDGMHGDNCSTVMCGVGEGDVRGKALIAAAQEALNKAVSVCGPGKCISEIGEAIASVASREKLQIVHEFCGHGTGAVLHMPPFILHFRNSERLRMEPGMIFTIEPIMVEDSRRVATWDDGWTIFTLDGGRGAQFEHEVLITPTGAEVLTLPI